MAEGTNVIYLGYQAAADDNPWTDELFARLEGFRATHEEPPSDEEELVINEAQKMSAERSGFKREGEP